MGGKDDASTAPRAFLNYIFFDRSMSFVSSGFAQISTAALGIGVHELISLNDLIPETDGYILAYLSNENNESVNVPPLGQAFKNKENWFKRPPTSASIACAYKEGR